MAAKLDPEIYDLRPLNKDAVVGPPPVACSLNEYLHTRTRGFQWAYKSDTATASAYENNINYWYAADAVQNGNFLQATTPSPPLHVALNRLPLLLKASNRQRNRNNMNFW
jgi:hypothetical protein